MIKRTLICFAAATGMAITSSAPFAQQAPGAGAPKGAAKGERPKGGTAPQPIRGTFPGPSRQPDLKLNPRADGKR